MYRFLYIIFAASFLLAGKVFGQIGGTSTWNFLNLTSSARIGALGGKNVALSDGDLNLAYFNPALLTEDMHNNLALNYATLFSGVSYGYVSYARAVPKTGIFAGGIHYINYGTFTAADETGQITGQFRAAEYALYLTYSRAFDTCWNAGITLKPVYSSLERYQAFGLAADLGASYTSPNRLFTAGIALRNMGLQFRGYYPGSGEPLPFEILAGVAQKLQYAPFRFLITAQQLQRFDLTYTNPAN
ncbi:MAG TPA: type IX secretion system protein PorQ, partial [Bacteroidales bacterium]|nr:type IX secretion system protein PorQ [Bacteroidales bacterium]